MDCFCPSCDCNGNDPHGPIGLVVRLGDKIKLSYNANDDGHSNDNTEYSDYVDSAYGESLRLKIKAKVQPLNVTFLDKRWLSMKNLLGVVQDREELSQKGAAEVKAHVIVKGACADGTTQLILLFDLSDWSLLFEPDDIPADTETPTSVRLSILSLYGKDNGKLVVDGDDNDGYNDTPRIKDGTFTQTWIAPPVFDSVLGSANKEKMRKIPIQIKIDKDGDSNFEYTFIRYIELIRTPVILVHGLWSTGSAFAGLARQLEQKGWRQDLLYRPSYDNKASLERNAYFVPKYVNQALAKAHRMMYACSKVDVVAHSMGGLLSKLIPCDFAEETVRKIITVGTPYQGSPWADLLWNVRGSFLGNTLDKLICASPLPVDPPAITGGAIEDLRTDLGNTALPVSTQVPGVDCRTVVVGEGLYAGLPSWYRYLLCLLTGKWTAEIIHTAIFGPGAESDWIVSEASQRYDAPSPSYIPVVWHCSETDDADFIDIVVKTLNEPAEIVSTTLPTGPVGGTTVINHNSRESQTPATTVGLYAESEFSGTVEILLPREGQTIRAGEDVTISLKGTGDTNEAVVFAFFGTESYADLVDLPWQDEVNVPPNSIGAEAKIIVVGLDPNRHVMAIDEVSLAMATSLPLEEVLFGFGDRWYFDFITDTTQSRRLQLYPMGRFSDDSEHPLSVLGNQTIYQSLNECVATVDSNGIVTVHARGEASIVVTNSSITKTVVIKVDAWSGDLDLDGDVDFADFALLANQWEEEGCIDLDGSAGVTGDDLAIFSEDWLLGIWPPIAADINGNSKVDFPDFALLANNWLETDCDESNNWCEGADFDKNGDVGLTDLAEITDYWLDGI